MPTVFLPLFLHTSEPRSSAKPGNRAGNQWSVLGHSQHFPFCIPQHHCPWALWGCPHPRALCSCWKSCQEHGLRVTPTFADFRSLNFLTSTHNISQKAHHVSALFSHTGISLNHLYLKGKEKNIYVWITVMLLLPRKGHSCRALWFELPEQSINHCRSHFLALRRQMVVISRYLRGFSS